LSDRREAGIGRLNQMFFVYLQRTQKSTYRTHFILSPGR